MSTAPRQLNVLVFTSLYPNNVWPNHGVFVKERMTAVSRLPHCKVRVIAPVPYFPPIRFGRRSAYARVAREETIDGVQVYYPRYLMIPRVAMFLQGWLMFLSLWPVLKKIEGGCAFGLIGAHYVYPDGFAAVLLGAVLRKPVLITARGSDINAFSLFPLIRVYLKCALRKAARVITVSNALRMAIVNLGVPNGKIHLIPNGVDSVQFRTIDAIKARSAIGHREPGSIILSVGGLTTVKGFDLLLNAFKIVCERLQTNKPYLIIVGDGPLKKDLEAQIVKLGLEANAKLVGSVPHEQLHLWYNAADLFCLASVREGLPNVILEALSCGIPVVASNVGGIPEIISNGSVGFLSEREPELLAQRVIEALASVWDRELIRTHVRNYSWNTTAERVADLFETVVKESPSSAISGIPHF